MIKVVEALGNKLINLRSPLHGFKWEGDWKKESKNWDDRMRAEIGELDPHGNEEKQEDEFTFWLSYLEAVSYFKSLNVCRAKNWNEVRIKGKFLRIQDIEKLDLEAMKPHVISLKDAEVKFQVMIDSSKELIMFGRIIA